MLMHDTPEVAVTGAPQRHDRRATSHCDIWDLIAPGVPCPACDDSFEDRLQRASSDD